MVVQSRGREGWGTLSQNLTRTKGDPMRTQTTTQTQRVKKPRPFRLLERRVEGEYTPRPTRYDSGGLLPVHFWDWRIVGRYSALSGAQQAKEKKERQMADGPEWMKGHEYKIVEAEGD